MSNVVEIVNFTLAEGFTSQDMMSFNESMNDFLNAQDGLIYRSLCETEQHSYIDIVYWQTMEFAKLAQQAFFASPLCEQFSQCIDKESVQLEYVKVLASAGCDS